MSRIIEAQAEQNAAYQALMAAIPGGHSEAEWAAWHVAKARYGVELVLHWMEDSDVPAATIASSREILAEALRDAAEAGRATPAPLTDADALAECHARG